MKTIHVNTTGIVSKLADQHSELFVVTVSEPATSDVAVTRVSVREFEKPHRRRREQRRLNNDFIFYL